MSTESRKTRFLRQTLQEVFDSNCKAYEIHLNTYKKIFNFCEVLEDKRDKLKDKRRLEEKISELKKFFNSDEFYELREYALLSASETESFVKQFSSYIPDDSLDIIIQDNEDEEEKLNRILGFEKEMLLKLKTNLFAIIAIAYDAKVKLVFTRKNSIAERIFTLYFQDNNNFENKRNVIQVKDCKLRRDFLKAYTASTESEKKKAFNWFETEAKKYKI